MHFIIEESVNVHPETVLNDHGHMETGEPTYEPEEAALRDRLMERSFEICERDHEDIYGFMHEIF